MADFTVTVQDQTIVVEPFGTSAIAPLVGVATQAVADANDAATLSGLYANADTDADIPGAAPGERGAKYFAEQAAAQIPLVEAAVAAIKYERSVDVIEVTGIVPAIVDLATSIPSAETYGRLYAVRKAGTGTASVSLAKNGAPFYGPITISGTEVDLDPAIAAAAGDDVQVVIESVTGSVTAFYLKLERA